MLLRHEIEERECAQFAPYAMKSRFTKGRVYHEEEHAYRTAFQRDKDRIIFSAAFRRLQYKTQVFSNFEGDYYRTRLTHTLEVSHISRSIARSLMLNEDLAEAVALAHDLGHGPFGHIGEHILNTLMQADGGFEHNRQSLRIVEKLEDTYPHFRGLNLTQETRNGLGKHSQPHNDDHCYLGSLEAQVVDNADSIAYCCHDIDDALRARLISMEALNSMAIWKEIQKEINEEYEQLNTYQHIYLSIRRLINTFVTDLATATEERIAARGVSVSDAEHRIVAFSDQMQRHHDQLRRFLYDNFYQNTRVVRLVAVAEKCIDGLFTFFHDNPKEMPKFFYERAQQEGVMRVVCDYVAGMTDRFAYDEYEKKIAKSHNRNN